MKKGLLIIDVQLGMFDESDPVFQGEILLKKINHLIGRARSADIPIFYIQHNERAGQPLEPGTPGWGIHPNIAPHTHDVIIQKNTPDSFHKTRLQQELETRSINELIVTGIQSEICVDTTCRRAFSLGYKVQLVSDAHSTWDSSNLTASQIIDHHNNLLRWFAEVKQSEAVFL
ncbi:cysteine hydrolase family protein [Paenibacillus marinisediminis]